ncbi:MAG TPA: TonB-dependent receptor [Bacteroidia bacterium]|nr:TonB-dependent receptor [Bacteroidia bacterium]
MKAKLLFLFPLFLLFVGANAQTIISGVVKDSKGISLPGVNIFIKDTYDGTTSDASGKYSFTTEETGEKILIATSIGFQPFEQKITIASEPISVSIKMKDAISELKTVTISAGSFEASDEKKMVMLRPLDIVTTAGASGDIYGAIQTLPGTGIVGEKEGLYVRGGDASETKTYIDGLLVDNPYFTSVPDVPQRGRFSPFLFKGTSFSSGGYSAQYGQAMSSVLILESQDLPEKSMSNIGIMSLGVSGGSTKRYKNTSIGVFGGYTDLGPYFALVSQNREWENAPRAINGSFLLRHKTSATGLIKAFVSYSWNELLLAVPDTSDPLLLRTYNYNLHNNNIYSSASYKEIVLKSWTMNAAVSYSDNRDHIRVNEYPIENKNTFFESRLTLSHSIGELSVLRFGGEFQNVKSAITVSPVDFKEKYSAAFVEADIYITPKLVSRMGLRGEYSQILDKTNLAPRVSLAYKSGEFSQFSFAYGNFYQVPQKNNILNYSNAGLSFEQATHYIFNFQHVSDMRTFRIETYYKDYNNLFYLNSANNFGTNTGYGHSRGIEFFYRDKKTIKRADYWISYSYLDTKRLYNDFRKEAMPAFAANHTASLVFKYFIPKISLQPSLTYAYSSGRPYYNPNNPDFLADRTIDYHNLSVSFSYLTSIRKSFTVLVFSVNNVAAVKNVFSYNYSSDGSNRMAVGPTADRFFFIGMFINIGSQKDDSDKYN